MTIPSRILLYADRTPAGAELRAFLENAGHTITWQSLDAEPSSMSPTDLVVLDGCGREHKALQVCRRLRGQLADAFVPILLLLEDTAPSTRLAGLEAGADTYLLRPLAPRELLAQVQAFLRMKQVHDRLSEKSAEVRRINQRLQQTYQQIDGELELARRIQRSFLPQQLPEMPPVRFAVHYLPCERVGGDFYDVFRLDEDHVGFYVADAMGHGMPASLLTIFIKKGVRAKEIFGSQYRLVPPDEVLRQLNRDMIDQALSETPFITMVYGLYNRRDGTLRFARAGHPYPIYLPRSGELMEWQVPGSLLGVFDTIYSAQTQVLRPGDRVLLYTDGLLASDGEAQPGAGARVLAGAAKLRELPLPEFVVRLAEEFEASKDDVTLLALEIEHL